MTTLKKPITWEGLSEVIGVAVGLLVAGVGLCLLLAFVIQWILVSMVGTTVSYWQVLGVLVIWELVKPRSSDK